MCCVNHLLFSFFFNSVSTENLQFKGIAWEVSKLVEQVAVYYEIPSVYDKPLPL